MAALDQLKKIFYLLENYLKILACSQVSDSCPLGYLSWLLIGSFSYLHIMITYMRAWMSLKFGQIQPLVFMVTDRVMMGKNGVSTVSRLFFIRSFSYLQVTMTCMRARTSSNFGLIGPPTVELDALECLKKSPKAYNGKNDASTFSWLFSIRYFSYLQAWMSLKFGQIRPLVLIVTDRVMMG